MNDEENIIANSKIKNLEMNDKKFFDKNNRKINVNVDANDW